MGNPSLWIARDPDDRRWVILAEVAQADAPVRAALVLRAHHQDATELVDPEVATGEQGVLVTGQVAAVTQQGEGLQQRYGQCADGRVPGLKVFTQRCELSGVQAVLWAQGLEPTRSER